MGNSATSCNGLAFLVSHYGRPKSSRLFFHRLTAATAMWAWQTSQAEQGSPQTPPQQGAAFAGTVPLQCTSGGPVIEDRLRSQASWHPSPAVARVSGLLPPSLLQSLVAGQARWGGWDPRRAVSDPSHHIASHWLPACQPVWPILLLICARGSPATTWQLRVGVCKPC